MKEANAPKTLVYVNCKTAQEKVKLTPIWLGWHVFLAPPKQQLTDSQLGSSLQDVVHMRCMMGATQNREIQTVSYEEFTHIGGVSIRHKDEGRNTIERKKQDGKLHWQTSSTLISLNLNLS